MKYIKINNIQCEIFPLHEGCLKDLCKKVYPTSTRIDRCPFCGKQLIQQYVYAVPVSKTECVKVQGSACINCDAFFSTSRHLLEGLERTRIDRKQYKYFVRFSKPNSWGYYDSLLDRESTLKQYVLYTAKKIVVQTIVWDKENENNGRGILHFSDEFARILMQAEKEEETVVQYKEEQYVIEQVRRGRNNIANKRLESMESNPEINSEMTLYVYFGDIHCLNRHHLVDFKAKIPTLDGDRGFWVQYCLECKNFYMKYRDYKVYLDRFGFFPMRADPIGMSVDYDDLAEYSPLRLNGYTTVDTTKEQRQKCLAHIMDYRIMEKRKVADYLEQFIRRGENNPSHQFAVSKWEEDLAFVLDYRLNEKPKVMIGTIEQRRP